MCSHSTRASDGTSALVVRLRAVEGRDDLIGVGRLGQVARRAELDGSRRPSRCCRIRSARRRSVAGSSALSSRTTASPDSPGRRRSTSASSGLSARAASSADAWSATPRASIAAIAHRAHQPLAKRRVVFDDQQRAGVGRSRWRRLDRAAQGSRGSRSCHRWYRTAACRPSVRRACAPGRVRARARAPAPWWCRTALRRGAAPPRTFPRRGRALRCAPSVRAARIEATTSEAASLASNAFFSSDEIACTIAAPARRRRRHPAQSPRAAAAAARRSADRCTSCAIALGGERLAADGAPSARGRSCRRGST